ncbi:hypothetical protein ILYODFUR_021632 [Ilyodon furcidens]|uniref:Uncharacterized protein n=1 Tax=Ilyodon furcidens TaxID=33524 RepID=A0ABV0TXR1_9TELE
MSLASFENNLPLSLAMRWPNFPKGNLHSSIPTKPPVGRGRRPLTLSLVGRRFLSVKSVYPNIYEKTGQKKTFQCVAGPNRFIFQLITCLKYGSLRRGPGSGAVASWTA